MLRKLIDIKDIEPTAVIQEKAMWLPVK